MIGIKVYTRPGPTSGTRPAVVEALVRSLLAAGLPPRQLVVWDRHLSDLRLAGYFELAEQYGIRVAGSAEAGYDPEVFYETPLLGRLIWGDLEFGSQAAGVGRKSFASKLVAAQMDKVISVTPILNHNLAGVSGHLLGLALASVDNTLRFEHSFDRLAEAVPEIWALETLGLRDRFVLAVTDGLICQYQGEERQLLHYSAVLGQLWFSRDPVASDVLAIQELARQRTAAGARRADVNMDLYDNAALLELGVSAPDQIEVAKPQ